MSMAQIYKKYLDVEIGDIVEVDYHPYPRQVTNIKTPCYVTKMFSHTFIYKYPIFSIALSDGGNINEIRFDTELGIYRTGRDVITFTKPNNRVQLPVDMFESYLSPKDAPYVFQDDVDYNQFFVWQCKKCGIDFNKDVSESPSFERHFTNCPSCQERTNRRIFWMDGNPFRYSYSLSASLSAPEYMKFYRVSEHQLKRNTLLVTT